MIFNDIIERKSYVPDLLADHSQSEINENLMKAFDGVHGKYGKKKLAIGACYLPNRTWSMNRSNLSRDYFSVDGFLKIW